MGWPTLLERRWFPLLLVLLWALAYLPSLDLRTLRLEEGRRATPAREMLASNDWVRPTLYGDTYLSKPPFFFWIIAAIGAVLGEVTPLATRLPSVLSSLGCALVVLRFAPNVLDRKTRSLASLFVLSTTTLLDKGTLGEIDATLCLFVAGALKVWWDGNQPEGQTLRSWVLVGLLLGISGLLKGPAGPSVFYLTIATYLLWKRQWRRLFSLGHVLCVLLAVAPSAVWVGALLQREVKPALELLVLWRIQLGADHAARSITDPGSQSTFLLKHYTEFPLQVAGMFLPGFLWLVFGFRRRWGEAHGLNEDLRRFLVCGAFVPFIAYYLYPQSRPRHLMAAFIPAEILAAYVVAGLANVPGRQMLRSLPSAIVLSWLPGLLGVVGVGLAAVVYPIGLWIAIPTMLICIAWSWRSVRLTRKTDATSGVFAFASTAACAALAVWFVVNAVVIPWRIPFNPSYEGKLLSEKLAPDTPVYTMLTFPVRGEGYYNLQFQLSSNLRAVGDLKTLKEQAPCQAIVAPFERQELEASGWKVAEIGRMGGGKGGPGEVHVIWLFDQK
ncbi:MAG: hypothetical protein EXS09_14515 [Gemmataceae bacterium]|nr:hypothetical protein [Gemmataceae bacterium]